MDELDLRILALAGEIDVFPDEIEKTSYGEYTYVVNRRKTKLGPSPREIQRRADLLHEALRFLGMDVETRNLMVAIGYAAYLRAQDYINHAIGTWIEFCEDDPTIPVFEHRELYEKMVKYRDSFIKHSEKEAAYRAFDYLFHQYDKTREMMKVGIHDLLNTLYHLTEDWMNERYPRNSDYQLSLCEAFEGREVVDRREEMWTDDGEYLVVTDEEANGIWSECLDSYADEFVLSQIPEQLQSYFDVERWKENEMGGGYRAGELNHYDGDEIEVWGIGVDSMIELIRDKGWLEALDLPDDIDAIADAVEYAFAELDEPLTLYIYRQ